MAIKFYSSIDVDQNDIHFPVIHKVSSAPSSPSAIAGQMYYNTSANTMHFYDGSSWQTLGTSAGDITSVTFTTDSGGGATATDASGDAAFSLLGGDGIGITNSSATITAAIDAAQTTITSILATDLKIGEDDQTKIDFETADTINFYAGNEKQLILTDGALTPGADNILDLGSSGVEFKDAYFDGTVTSDAFAGPLTGDVTGNADTATVATTVTITDNESTDEDNALIFTAGGDVDGGNIGLESDGTLTYNPSTGTVTATGFSGNLTGTLQTAAQGNVTSLGTLTALTVDDVAVDGKVITMTGSTNDTATMTVGTNGTLAITTTDTAAAAANMTLTADGAFEAIGTTVTLDSGGAINLEPASGSAILLDGTISVDAGVVTGATSITSTAFVGDITGDVTGTSSLATVTNSTANTNFPVVFNNESDALLDDTGALYYNPSTGLLTVPNLSVAGTTTQVNTVTMNAANAVVFEGATADAHETTLTIVDPLADQTIYLPDAGGYVPLIADASTADGAVTAAEFALLDGGSTVATGAFADGDGLLHNDGGTMKQTNVSSLATLFAGAGMTASSSVVNVIGGDGITANANDVAITAAQTTITSILATDVKIGEDDQTKIDFETANEIHFYADNAEQVYVADGVLGPQSDSDVDLGTTGVRFKDAFVDSITVTGEVDGASLDISGNADIDGTLETDALTIDGTAIVAQATASAVGGVELATAAEVITGTDAARVVTADTLSAKAVVCTIAASSLTDDLRATITHSLGTADTIVQLFDMTTEANVYADIGRTTDDMSTASTSVITVDFGTTPDNDVRVVITSLAGATAGSVAYT